jgi:hypothetical protein
VALAPPIGRDTLVSAARPKMPKMPRCAPPPVPPPPPARWAVPDAGWMTAGAAAEAEVPEPGIAGAALVAPVGVLLCAHGASQGSPNR